MVQRFSFDVGYSRWLLRIIVQTALVGALIYGLVELFPWDLVAQVSLLVHHPV